MPNVHSRNLLEVPFSVEECYELVPRLLALTERDDGTLEGDYLAFLTHPKEFSIAHLFYYTHRAVIVGQCTVFQYTSQVTPLVSTFVQPAYRRKGIGTALLKVVRSTYPKLPLRACTNDKESAGFYGRHVDSCTLLLVNTYTPGDKVWAR